MKNLSPKEAITILEGMRIDIPLPKAAVTQMKRNLALDMAINALNCSEIPNNSDTISRQQAIDAVEKNACNTQRIMDAINNLPSAQPAQHGRIFQEIVVEYPSYCACPEYKGKPYFSIKYTENGQELIGYGTYKIKVLSEYLKEYFMPSAQPYTIHSDGRLWVTVDDIDKVNAVVVDESKSKFCKQFYMDAQPEPKRGKWIIDRSGRYCCNRCMEPCAGYVMMKPRDKFCKMFGSRNEVME